MEQEKKKEEKKVVKAPRVKSKAPVRFPPFSKIIFFHNFSIFQIMGQGRVPGIQKVFSL